MNLLSLKLLHVFFFFFLIASHFVHAKLTRFLNKDKPKVKNFYLKKILALQKFSTKVFVVQESCNYNNDSSSFDSFIFKNIYY